MIDFVWKSAASGISLAFSIAAVTLLVKVLWTIITAVWGLW